MTTEVQKAAEQPRLNTLIPMEDEEGNRCFVNSWDVPNRTADGWKVLGDIKKHTSTTKAPTGVLTAGDSAPGKPAEGDAPTPNALAAERDRVRAILKDADDEQSTLADKLIADGTPAATAIKALAADRKIRKEKAGKTDPSAPAAAAAQPPK